MFDFFKTKIDCYEVYVLAERAYEYNSCLSQPSNIFTNVVAVYESYADAIDNLEHNQYIMGPLPYHKMQNPDCNLTKDYKYTNDRDPGSPRQSPKTRRKD